MVYFFYKDFTFFRENIYLFKMKASEIIEINKKQNKTTNNNKKISKLFTLDEIIKEIYNN